jgi:hypothetical protein
LFLVAISVASLLPIIFIPATYHVVSIRAAFYVVAGINILGATFHVAATGWFFTDPAMRAYFRSKPGRYFVMPSLVIAASALAFQFLDRGITSYLVGAYLLWQLWHYQKQNFGLLSFISAGTDKVPLSKWERRTLTVAALPGMLGFFRFFGIGLPEYEPEFLLAHHVGFASYAVVAVFFAIAVAKHPPLRTNGLRLAFFTYGTLFFLPTYLFPDDASAITGFALAHGLQYLVFMGVVSGRSKKPFVSGALFLGISLIGYFLLSRGLLLRDLTNLPYAGAISGAALGVVMSHFIMDADIWRMRGAFQRGYMGKKFDFVFSR